VFDLLICDYIHVGLKNVYFKEVFFIAFYCMTLLIILGLIHQ
jgi:hypothetical protein